MSVRADPLLIRASLEQLLGAPFDPGAVGDEVEAGPGKISHLRHRLVWHE
jgi:hypothetical protein